jgi:hypothetical protein
MTASPIPEDYKNLLAEIKHRIRSAQYEALKVVNQQLIALYWDICSHGSRKKAKEYKIVECRPREKVHGTPDGK